MNKKTDAQIIATGFINCAIWADAPEGTRPRITAEAKEKADKIAWQFIEIVGVDVIAQLAEITHYGAHPDCGNDRPHLIACGHDLWLTSQGHGAGFWDRELPEELSEKLCAASAKFSSIYMECYRGWIYFHGNYPLSLSI